MYFVYITDTATQRSNVEIAVGFLKITQQLFLNLNQTQRQFAMTKFSLCSSSCFSSSVISQSFNDAIDTIMDKGGGSYRRDFAEIQQQAVANSQRKKQRTEGTKHGEHKGEGAKFLKEQFTLFKDTDGKEGFDYDLTSPARIRDIYDAHPDKLGAYIRTWFSKNYIGTANRWKVNNEKEGTRSLGLRRSKFLFIYFILH